MRNRKNERCVKEGRKMKRKREIQRMKQVQFHDPILDRQNKEEDTEVLKMDEYKMG